MARQHILAVVQADLQLIWTLRRAIETEPECSLAITRNSQEAILYLRGVGVYGDRWRYPLPTMVIVDSENTDGSDLEVLEWMRGSKEFAGSSVALLCSQTPVGARVSCALDPHCFLLNRNPADLIRALANVRTAGSPIPRLGVPPSAAFGSAGPSTLDRA